MTECVSAFYLSSLCSFFLFFLYIFNPPQPSSGALLRLSCCTCQRGILFVLVVYTYIHSYKITVEGSTLCIQRGGGGENPVTPLDIWSHQSSELQGKNIIIIMRREKVKGKKSGLEPKKKKWTRTLRCCPSNLLLAKWKQSMVGTNRNLNAGIFYVFRLFIFWGRVPARDV